MTQSLLSIVSLEVTCDYDIVSVGYVAWLHLQEESALFSVLLLPGAPARDHVSRPGFLLRAVLFKVLFGLLVESGPVNMKA